MPKHDFLGEGQSHTLLPIFYNIQIELRNTETLQLLVDMEY